MALNKRATGIIIPLQVEFWAPTYNIYNWFVGTTFANVIMISNQYLVIMYKW